MEYNVWRSYKCHYLWDKSVVQYIGCRSVERPLVSHQKKNLNDLHSVLEDEANILLKNYMFWVENLYSFGEDGFQLSACELVAWLGGSRTFLCPTYWLGACFLKSTLFLSWWSFCYSLQIISGWTLNFKNLLLYSADICSNNSVFEPVFGGRLGFKEKRNWYFMEELKKFFCFSNSKVIISSHSVMMATKACGVPVWSQEVPLGLPPGCWGLGLSSAFWP